MTDDLPIVLLHGSATGSHSWAAVRMGLEARGARALAPDMLGYGRSPTPSEAWQPKDEVSHLRGWLDMQGVGAFHLVTHSLGAFFGLHLRLAVGSRVARLTLIDPVVVSVLRVPGEEDALREGQTLCDRFMRAWPDHGAAACLLVEHWSGAGAWNALGEKGRALVTRLAPRLRLEMTASAADRTTLAEFTSTAVPTLVLVGERTSAAPRSVSRLLAGAFDARTVVVPGAAHMIPLTHPAAVVEAIHADMVAS
ncbi:MULTISPECIES: alpha/beta fold hydrolase [unclassified Bradyrhizobium]|uniref:alpha/beta fold hydrolase n=1 Tax=unclassified Bradyrhizobium TaxID=2631580 RepID=UPI001FFA9E00|nr:MULTISPECIES: alpha/beta fold hydrolase [unclassified Bradyrhizobium]MCK1304724.1 alpha/beta hydrolase [Bradyrhizobium sp. 45]MCK1314105.1 alpha/beta hydrolase [Bradyrhizobium sp. 23]MCK1439863.1 alpha/beta hydrolase [Bradyrhizobium sp. 15]MCK1505397.1 alpha/beta hydrolase [Bradyrhizobium sp. 18]MCK1608115.1 alpha/beta hydrolase [Bradyrhizobium sp. 163]